MKFNPERMAFGRHGTFAVRYAWLPKGFQAISENRDVFESDDATVTLGIGKNMVSAIKYWLHACRMIDPVFNIPTDMGKALLSEEGFDPYLEDDATIWLLHWLLATNAELATSWFWFFNRFHKPEFTGQEIGTALADFVNDKIVNKKKPALATLSNDSGLIPRMYTQSTGNTRTSIEDALDSPFSVLKLITQNAGGRGRGYQSLPMARPDLPLGVVGFAVCEMFEMKQTSVIPTEDLMYSKDNYPAIGSVFRLTENDLITKLENLVEFIPGILDMRDTAGQHQIYLLGTIDAIEFLTKHYENS